jgi:hypothetical protein
MHSTSRLWSAKAVPAVFRTLFSKRCLAVVPPPVVAVKGLLEPLALMLERQEEHLVVLQPLVVLIRVGEPLGSTLPCVVPQRRTLTLVSWVTLQAYQV